MHHFLPWYYLTTVVKHFLPWYHFTTVLWLFPPWYHFTTLIAFYYRDGTLCTLISVWSKNIRGGGGRRPPEPLPLIRHCLFYCHDVTFCTLISSRVPRDGTLSTLIMISRPWCTRPFGCFAEHFYTVFVRPWSEFVFIVRRCLVFFISRLSTSRMKIKVLTASAGAWGKGTGKIGSLVLVLRARYCSVCSSIFEKTKEKKSLCTDYAVPFSKKSF